MIIIISPIIQQVLLKGQAQHWATLTRALEEENLEEVSTHYESDLVTFTHSLPHHLEDLF